MGAEVGQTTRIGYVGVSWCFQKYWYPKMDGWFKMENPMNKWMIWEVKTPTFGSTPMWCGSYLWKEGPSSRPQRPVLCRRRQVSTFANQPPGLAVDVESSWHKKKNA